MVRTLTSKRRQPAPAESKPLDLPHDQSAQAVVLSGSGCSSTAAYEVGALRALMEQGAGNSGGFNPAIYSGSAFGAFNAAIMASQAGGDTAGTLRYLESAWLDGICSTPDRVNGVYRLRGNPFAFFDPRSYSPLPIKLFVDAVADFAFLSKDLLERIQLNFGAGSNASLAQRLLSLPAMTPLFDMAPLQGQLRKHVKLDLIRSSTKELMVTATDWARGMPRIFTREAMTDPEGYAILQASAAFTLAFPFVQIDGRPFSGAPGTLATPLKPVIETYAHPARPLTIHVIFLDPLMKNIPIDKMDNALGGLGRWFTLNEAVNIHADVEYASSKTPDISPGGASVTIHRYRPKKIIVNWFDFANFGRTTTEAYIAQGYEETLQHNCEAEGCTLAG